MPDPAMRPLDPLAGVLRPGRRAHAEGPPGLRLADRAELARIAGVSVRQLERLFRAHLGRSIGAHYLGLRLEQARRLLRQTSLSVLETGLACGFASAAHFSRSYRARFGVVPRADRQAEAAGKAKRPAGEAAAATAACPDAARGPAPAGDRRRA